MRRGSKKREQRRIESTQNDWFALLSSHMFATISTKESGDPEERKEKKRERRGRERERERERRETWNTHLSSWSEADRGSKWPPRSLSDTPRIQQTRQAVGTPVVQQYMF